MPEQALRKKHAQAENQLAIIRTIIIVFNSVVYLVGDPSGSIPKLAYAVIVIALVYTGLTLLLRNRPKPAWLLTGYYTSITDSVLITVWVVATGGAASPFLPLWFISLAAIALRFDFKKTIVTSIVYAIVYVSTIIALGQFASARTETVVRAAYIIFAGLISAVTSKFWFDEVVAREEIMMRMGDARAAEAKFRGLLEFSPDPIIVIDSSRRITIMNGTAEKLFAAKRDEMMGRPVTDLFAQRSRESFSRWSESALMTVGSRVGSFDGRRGDAEFPLEVFTSAFEGEDGAHVIFVMRDIAERRAAEEERVANEARLKELQRLKDIDRFKTQFINNAAHELGTPLTPIKMQIHILQTAGVDNLEPSQKRAIEVLKRNVDRLSVLVKDVLDAARAQAERLGIERKPVDINRVVQEAVESFEESARREGITLVSTLTPNLVLPADEKRLTQVLFNLLSNAVKFSPTGTQVVVATSREGDNIIITVTDTGIGIDPAAQHRLFQPFSQLQDPRERTRAGTGLGLYISKSLVELHGGRLTVHSDGPGLGTRFTIVLPLQPPPRIPASPAPAVPPFAPAAPATTKDNLQSRVKELV